MNLLLVASLAASLILIGVPAEVDALTSAICIALGICEYMLERQRRLVKHIMK